MMAHVLDLGPEFTARAIPRWLDTLEVNTLFIERASPWERRIYRVIQWQANR